LITLFLSIALGAVATLAAYLLHRRINRPLQQLLRAADHLGSGGWPEPLMVSGPSELAVVAKTFNRMTEGLVEIESTRAAMLAGISHDIRTPLTKLRLALAMPESLDAPLSSAERFVDEIDVIVQQFIDFARGGDGEDASIGDLDELIGQLANDFAGLGHSFKLSLGIAHGVPFRPVSTLRMLMNVMQNAVTYGQVGLEVATWSDERWAYVCVQDSGAGIPEEMLSVVKQPFRRGPQVGYQRPGTGLGLAIANRIARQHGGSLDLSRRPHGGMTVRISLQLKSRNE
jgi:two-component system osmolarity sensor histidine kinase EnvZ